MKLKHRLSLFVSGMAIILYALLMMHTGRSVYRNWYGMTLFSPGVFTIGIIFSLLAFLPPASWLTALTKRKGEHAHLKK